MAVPKQSGKGDAVCYLPFEPPVPSRRIGMLYRKGSYRAAAFERIADEVRAVAAHTLSSGEG
jgi:DNA-binding transcriptional LysR family regulator